MPAPRVRVHEVSKIIGLSNAEVIKILTHEMDTPVKSHSSTIDQETAEKLIKTFKKSPGQAEPQASKTPAKPEPQKPSAQKSAQKKETPTQDKTQNKIQPPPQPAASIAFEKQKPETESNKAGAAFQKTQEKTNDLKNSLPSRAPGAGGYSAKSSTLGTNPAAAQNTGQQRQQTSQAKPSVANNNQNSVIKPAPPSKPPEPQVKRTALSATPYTGHASPAQRPPTASTQPNRQNNATPINTYKPGQQSSRTNLSYRGVKTHDNASPYADSRNQGTSQPGNRPPQNRTGNTFKPSTEPGNSALPVRDRSFTPQKDNNGPIRETSTDGRRGRSDGKRRKDDSSSDDNRDSKGKFALNHGTSYKPGGSSNAPHRSLRSGRHTSKAKLAHKEKLIEEETAKEALPKIVTLEEAIIVRDLAHKLHIKDTELIKHLFMKGMMVTVNQVLDLDFAKGIARELDYEVIESTENTFEGEYAHLGDNKDNKLDASKYKNLQSRSPVISIMGHVDHGKTTLLDSIRETRNKVVDSESGGITQSIGAYCVEKNDERIVFLDTPGHEAFTSMRLRGAQSTDIAVLVVAADDGIMPQTIEAINHAKVAKIPIIVAVNKIDKENADPDRVLTQLSEYGLSPEKWGGDTLTVEISALQKLGIDDLLDSILLVAELLELKADATVAANGVIIEAQLDKRTGPIATILVQNGTLAVGDNVLIGSVGGRVRALIDDFGKRITSAGPATPVEILGLNGVPNAGEPFEVIKNDKAFKQKLADYRQKEREERIGVTRSVSAGFSGKSEIEAENSVQESQFNLLVKADSQGSLEAVVDILQQMTNEEVKINIVHSGTGDISEADVMLSSAANALIIGFNSRPDSNAQKLSETENVSIRHYDVIYHIAEDIEKWVLGQLSPETEDVLSGTAEVRQLFKVGRSAVIAGCMVVSGKVFKNAKAVVLRDSSAVFNGTVFNLKRFKDDVKEVASGFECGISFERFQDIQEGDVIEVYTTKSLERTSF
ncbi:MAG: translation initiation factor IF-2 [Cyanobacteria bacterium P01_H01_bin.74]